MNIKILALCIGAGIAVHALAFYMLSDIKFDSPMINRTLMERQTLSVETIINREHLQEKRNQQIAAVFQQLQSKATSLQYELAQISLDMQTIPLEKETPLAIDSLDPSATVADDLAELSESLLQDEKLIDEPILTIVAPDQFDDEALIEELAQAAEKLEGILEQPIEGDLNSHDKIKLGTVDLAALHGNALHAASGLIDQGEILRKESFLTSKIPVEPNLNSSAQLVLEIPEEHMSTITASNAFSVKVVYAAKKNGEGYLFRIELQPNEIAQFKTIKQNLFFLIDRSHSIPEKRYELAKEAVVQALAYLHPDDTFNVLVFDHSVIRLSPENLPCNPDSLAKAKEFLSQQKHGGIFATTDLYASLGNIIPKAVEENEVNTAILLSDGDSSLKIDKQRQNIASWIKQNSGKISLYSIAAGNRNNLALLDLLSTFNKGSLFYTADEPSISASLQKLVRSIADPIGKEISVTAVPIKDDTKITLYPAPSGLPNLYGHSTYVIYGSTNQLEDFPIFFQGKCYDKWVDIKKIISFKEAQEIEAAPLEKMWAMFESSQLYSKYLIDGNRAHILQAKQLLAPYNLPLAFE